MSYCSPVDTKEDLHNFFRIKIVIKHWVIVSEANRMIPVGARLTAYWRSSGVFNIERRRTCGGPKKWRKGDWELSLNTGQGDPGKESSGNSPRDSEKDGKIGDRHLSELIGTDQTCRTNMSSDIQKGNNTNKVSFNEHLLLQIVQIPIKTHHCMLQSDTTSNSNPRRSNLCIPFASNRQTHQILLKNRQQTFSPVRIVLIQHKPTLALYTKSEIWWWLARNFLFELRHLSNDSSKIHATRVLSVLCPLKCLTEKILEDVPRVICL